MYYKVRIEGWIGQDPAGMELEDIAFEMTEGQGYCTLQETIKVVDKVEDIEDDAVIDFFEGGD